MHDSPRSASASARLHQARTTPPVYWLASPASPSPDPSNATNCLLMAKLGEKHQEAEAAVQGIHDQLDALDPATRAAVVARLTSDEVKRVRGD
jgi:hypothetical protein